MRGDSGVAGEGRVVGVPKFHSWGKCTMPLTNINSDWMFNASSGLCIILVIYVGPLSCILGCNYAGPLSCILGCNIDRAHVLRDVLSNHHPKGTLLVSLWKGLGEP